MRARILTRRRRDNRYTVVDRQLNDYGRSIDRLQKAEVEDMYMPADVRRDLEIFQWVSCPLKIKDQLSSLQEEPQFTAHFWDWNWEGSLYIPCLSQISDHSSIPAPSIEYGSSLLWLSIAKLLWIILVVSFYFTAGLVVVNHCFVSLIFL